MVASAMNLRLPSTAGSLESYISAVNGVPLLSLEEEQALTRRYRDEDDLGAARELVFAHLRFVVKVARGYSGYGLAHGDLIQEGNIGLMKAVKRFDPDVGVRLVSFAVHWIKAEIHEFILRNWRIVKIATTKAQRKLFFKLRSTKKALGWMGTTEIKRVAQELGVDEREVMTMEQRLSAHDLAFDGGADSDDDDFAPAGYLESQSYGPASEFEHGQHNDMQHEQLGVALSDLDERSRDIVVSRWLQEPKATLHDLAARYGISAERIRQLEKNAFNKIRKALPGFGPEGVNA
jgi:RNA polymerase sigma-32 factor